MQILQYTTSRFLAVLAVFAFFGFTPVQGASYALFVNITQPLLDGDGQPLADGSLIYVITTPHDQPQPMETFGNFLIGDSTTGGEVIIATIRVDSTTSVHGSGTVQTIVFDIPVEYFASPYSNLYLRFFDYRGSAPPSGTNIAWGTSDLIPIPDPVFNTIILNVPGGQVSATNDFIIIPEPGTLHLFVVAGLVMALFFVRRDTGRKARGDPCAASIQNE
jgi:hypothetical protein